MGCKPPFRGLRGPRGSCTRRQRRRGGGTRPNSADTWNAYVHRSFEPQDTPSLAARDEDGTHTLRRWARPFPFALQFDLMGEIGVPARELSMRWSMIRAELKAARTDLSKVLVQDRLAAPVALLSRGPEHALTGGPRVLVEQAQDLPLNGSSLDGTLARRYAGGSSERSAARTVWRTRPSRLAIALMPIPSGKCSRRMSAHWCTSSLPPGRLSSPIRLTPPGARFRRPTGVRIRLFPVERGTSGSPARTPMDAGGARAYGSLQCTASRRSTPGCVGRTHP